LSRLFSPSSSSGPRTKSKNKAMPPGGPQYRRKLCFIGDGACGKTCLLV
jgi:GTPase SAR1 family protein